MSLEEKDVSFVEMKEMKKRKVVVSGVIGKNLVAGKRVLRSDAAKQREKEDKEANDVSGKNYINGGISIEESKFEKKRVLRSSCGKKRELNKTQLKKSSKEVVVRNHESTEMTVRTCENTLSSDVLEKTKGAVDGDYTYGMDIEDQIDRSDITMQRGNNGIKDKRAIEEGGNSENAAIEIAPLGNDCNGASIVKCEDKSEPASSERKDTEERNFDEVSKVALVEVHGKSGDTNKEVALVEVASKTGQKIISAGRIRKKTANIMVENRRLTRSSAAKQMEVVDTSTTVTPEISNQTCIKIEKKIVGSKICKKKIIGGKVEVEKRRDMKSDTARQKNEAGTSKKRKKSMESGLDRNISEDAPVAATNRKKTGTRSASCKENRAKEVHEEKKLMTGSKKISSLKIEEAKRQKNDPNGKRIESKFKTNGWLQGEKVEWTMTLKELKQNVITPARFREKDLNNAQHKNLRTQGIEHGSNCPSTNKKVLGSGKSHIHSVAGKTSSFKEIWPASSSPLKELKSVDSSCDNRDVMMGGESTNFQFPQKQKNAEELRVARMKLRDQIKGMLFNAGWKLDLRPRKGRNCLDPVYIAPNGYTHWSILKAYYAFQKQFNHEHDKGRHKKPYEKSQKSIFPSFSPIAEEALSILKRRIFRRRTYKEIAEDNLKRGISNTSQKVKKYMMDDIYPMKGGKCKGRRRKVSLLSSRANGAVNSVGNKLHLGRYKRKQKGNALLVRSFNQDLETRTDVYVPYAWKRTILSWVIDSGVIPENAVMKYMNQRHTKTLMKGQITRDGIRCDCCSKIFTVSDFEIHAGSKKCKPYQNILVDETGTSLSQCQINAWEKQDESERRGFYSVDIHGDDQNDDTCGICGDGGDLVCCDSCPSTFHQSCLGTKILPSGDWYCVNCSCRYCMPNSGVVAQEKSGIDFSLLSCSQCQQKYHETCIPVEDAINTSSRRPSIPFCGQNCKNLFEKLRMLLGVKNFLDEGFSWTIVQRFDKGLPESADTLDQWAECNSKVAVALAVMDECFLPIIDKRSGINLIHNVVYNCGSNFSRLNYSSFYTFILERNDEIISVASLRIHGNRAAEMPFIGTRNTFRRQGMCRRLLNEIEMLLHSLNIEKLIIPAISELNDTWTNVFGFKLMKVSEREEIRSINLLVFPGTRLLVKHLLEKDSIEHSNPADKGQLGPEAAHDAILQHPTAELKPRDFIDQHKLGTEHSEHSFSISDGMESHSNVPSKDSDAHVDFQAPEIKSSNNVAQKDLASQPEVVSLDECDADNSLT